MNSVNIMGRLARDPEVKQTEKTAICGFAVGFNDPYNKDKSNFIDCVAFGKTAETIGEYLKKGDPILITGRLQQDKWVAKDGSNRSKIVLNCERFSFVPKSKDTGGSAPSQNPSVTQEPIPF